MERAWALLAQEPPKGARLLLALAVPADDKLTLKVAEKLMATKAANGVAVDLVKRKPGTTSVEGWNLAFQAAYAAGADWFIAGADDIVWRTGWLEEALRVAQETGAEVVGLNDGDNTNTKLDEWASHSMVSRRFALEEMGGVMAPPGYGAWWFDREIVEKARAKGLYAPAHSAYAEHHHPDWKLAEEDDTYRLGIPFRDADGELFEARKAAGFPTDYKPLVRDKKK
jgi:hypothetical protein